MKILLEEILCGIPFIKRTRSDMSKLIHGAGKLISDI